MAAATVKFATKKLLPDESPATRALASWQLQQAVVPAVQLGAIATAVIVWDAEYDLGATQNQKKSTFLLLPFPAHLWSARAARAA